MIDPDLVIAHLQTLSLFKVVGGAAEAAALMGTGQAVGEGPNAYVVPMADDAAKPASQGGPQRVTGTFGVLLMVRRHGDALGQKTMNRLRPLRMQLLTGMLGLQLAPELQPCWWRGGRMHDFTKESLWWLDEYAADYGVAPALFGQ